DLTSKSPDLRERDPSYAKKVRLHGPVLEVVPGVREIEALVAEREIRNLISPERHRQREPIVEGRVDHFVGCERSHLAGEGEVERFAAPALHDGDREVTRRRLPHALIPFGRLD